jgi:outer membrane protein assembly factor BamB
MPEMPSLGSRRWLPLGLVAATILLLVIAGAATFVLLHAPGNISNPAVAFTSPTTTQTTPPPKPKPKSIVVSHFLWPWFGYDGARTHDFSADSALHPPFRQGWFFDDLGLLEFPPVIYQNTLYLLDDNGWLKAVNKLSGQLIWQHHLGTLAAASPAIDIRNGLVLVPLLSVTPPPAGHAATPGNGRLVAVTIATGRTVWSLPLPAGSESSPIVANDTVFFGDQGGTVWAVRAGDGHVDWTYHASGAVKGGPALADGKLYFGDYSGRAYAIEAANGHEVWSVGTSGTHFGFGSGEFYSTPAVAYGRVYMGNTDGRVYSFAADSGELAWATSTGGYVYGSPAVATVPGLGPTVYVGSYSGQFYAFNAQSGAVRWSRAAGGKISGSAVIIGNVVYFSDLGTKKTTGLNIRTGQQVFSFRDGVFNPAVADYGAIYLIGYTSIYEMLPITPQPAAAPAAAAGAAKGAHAVRKAGAARAAPPKHAVRATPAPRPKRAAGAKPVPPPRHIAAPRPAPQPAHKK